jgi:hypothetical protein
MSESPKESPELKLPAEILHRSSLLGNEYAWRPSDIPDVIEAARRADLVNIGGQLQFRFPDATCECYWVEVDTSKSVARSLAWRARVDQTADAALAEFQRLQFKFDFVAEGRNSYPNQFEKLSATEIHLQDVTFFVWYLEAAKAS